MLIADLEIFLSGVPEPVRDYALYLACPDTVAADNADEQTAIIGDVELSADLKEARLYPPFALKVTDDAQCYKLRDLLNTLHDDPDLQPDLKLVAELPLVREDSVSYITSLVPVVEIHIGSEAEEVWLLLAPASEFPANSLPA